MGDMSNHSNQTKVPITVQPDAHGVPRDDNRTHPGVLLGSGFAVAVGLFGWLGHLWDEKTGRAPLGVLLGVSLGLVYGAYEVWKLVRRDKTDLPASEFAAPVPKEKKRVPLGDHEKEGTS